MARLEGELASVEALKDLKDELIQAKQVGIVLSVAWTNIVMVCVDTSRGAD